MARTIERTKDFDKCRGVYQPNDLIQKHDSLFRKKDEKEEIQGEREEEWKLRDYVYDTANAAELLHTVTNKEARSSASVHWRTHLSSHNNSTGVTRGCPIKLIITKYYSLLMARYFTIYVCVLDADATMANFATIKRARWAAIEYWIFID